MTVLCGKAWSMEQLLAQSQAQACSIFFFSCRVYSSELHLDDEVQVDLFFSHPPSQSTIAFTENPLSALCSLV